MKEKKLMCMKKKLRLYLRIYLLFELTGFAYLGYAKLITSDIRELEKGRRLRLVSSRSLIRESESGVSKTEVTYKFGSSVIS